MPSGLSCSALFAGLRCGFSLEAGFGLCLGSLPESHSNAPQRLQRGLKIEWGGLVGFPFLFLSGRLLPMNLTLEAGAQTHVACKALSFSETGDCLM